MLGKNITEVRKSKKLSQAALGKLIGTSGDVVGRYERGSISPSIEAVTKIAEALGVSIDYLVGNTTVEIDTKMLDRMKKIGEMPSEEQVIVYRVIDSLLREYNTRKSYE